MIISKKAQYAIRAVIVIAQNKSPKPTRINHISETASIPQKYLEQILLNLKNNGILLSRRGANGGYLLAKPSHRINLNMIIEIMDGPFDPLGTDSSLKHSIALKECFYEMIKIIKNHLNQFTIKDILEKDAQRDSIFFEI